MHNAYIIMYISEDVVIENTEYPKYLGVTLDRTVQTSLRKRKTKNPREKQPD